MCTLPPRKDGREFQVSHESRRATTKCPSGFSCLSGDEKSLCAVERCVDGKIYFVTRRDEGDCCYRYPFGTGIFCTCPVRKELFDRFGV